MNINNNKKNIPQMRFKGFDGEWTTKKYTDVFDTSISNNTLSRADLTSEETSVKNVHYGDILIKYGSVLDVKKDEFQFVPDQIKIDSKNYLKDGDLIFADTAEDETCGKATEINNLSNEKVVAGLHTFVARPKTEFEEKYLGYFVNSPVFHNQLIPYMQGTKVTSISKANIQKTSLAYPESAEQSKIGALFSSIDLLITSTQKEHDKLVALKKCMLQKMFPKKGSLVPEIRFKGFEGDWEIVSWKDTVDISTEMVNPQEEQYQELPHIAPGNIESFTGLLFDNVNKVKDENLISGKFHFYKNDIVYGKINPQLGKYYFATCEGLTSADAYVLNARENLSQTFLFVVLQTKEFFKYSVSVSKRSGMPKINRNQLNSYSFVAPSIEEQQKIGSYFQNLDNLIFKQSQELEKLKNIKKTMLSKMFV